MAFLTSISLKGEWEQKAKKYDEMIGKLSQDIEWAETTTTTVGGQKMDQQKKSRNILPLFLFIL